MYISELWKKAYTIAKGRLCDIELAELDLNSLSNDSVFTVLVAAEAARNDKDNKKWRYTARNGEVVILRDRFDRIVDGFDKYAKVVDVAINHSPQISSLVWASARFLIQVSTIHHRQARMIGAHGYIVN